MLHVSVCTRLLHSSIISDVIIVVTAHWLLKAICATAHTSLFHNARKKKNLKYAELLFKLSYVLVIRFMRSCK